MYQARVPKPSCSCTGYDTTATLPQGEAAHSEVDVRALNLSLRRGLSWSEVEGSRCTSILVDCPGSVDGYQSYRPGSDRVTTGRSATTVRACSLGLLTLGDGCL